VVRTTGGWGIYARPYALVTLQVCLADMNIRSEKKKVNARSALLFKLTA
jgi:hypothetical protein